MVEIGGSVADVGMAHVLALFVRVAVILSVVGYVNGFLIDVVAWEPTPLAVELSIPPSRWIAVIYLDDLTA